MRASPAFQVCIVRFGAWRAMVSAIVLVASSALAAWWWAGDDARPAILRLAALPVGIALLSAGLSLLRCTPLSLRWDTQCWHLGPASTMGDEPWHGRLAVALDLGPWMLLRFEHDLTNGRCRTRWVPVQGRGLERQWHALRCAVYSARPAEGHAAGPPAAIRPESQE